MISERFVAGQSGVFPERWAKGSGLALRKKVLVDGDEQQHGDACADT